MASSAHKQQEHVPNMYGATAAPPPTPSALSSNPMSTSTAADTLSRLLHRLPPKLSLPTRRSPSAASPPVVSLSDENPNDRLLSASSKVGYFQVSDHNISSQVANSAAKESLSLFELDRNQKETYFPKNWPLGFEPAELEDEEEENDEDGERNGGSFCLDSTCSTESTEVSLTSLREFTRATEKVGLKIIETLARAVGFDNPIGEDPTRFCSLMWISQMGSRGDKPVVSGGLYPYIVGLQYQIREQKYSLLSDAGSAAVSPQVDSVLVTLGDIAHVWSNGKLKKVRGRPTPFYGNGENKSSNSISMTLLVTLPMESTISPLIPKVDHDDDDHDHDRTRGSSTEDQYNISKEDNTVITEKKDKEEAAVFESFAFEDYAWRLYHERLLFKDTLDRYRI